MLAVESTSEALATVRPQPRGGFGLARYLRPRKNARVATSGIRSFVAALGLLVFSFAIAACPSPAEKVEQNINTKADESCKSGNEAACHTIIQVMGPSHIAIESTLALDATADQCKQKNQDACEQLAAMHAELSSWCSSGNTRACAELQSDKWPKDWDEAALLDAARIKCVSGELKKVSPTCKALNDM